VSRKETLAYGRVLVSTFQENPAHDPDLVGELDRVVSEMGRRPRTHSDPMNRVATRTGRAASSSHQENEDR
jgi:hypothetical protein